MNKTWKTISLALPVAGVLVVPCLFMASAHYEVMSQGGSISLLVAMSLSAFWFSVFAGSFAMWFLLESGLGSVFRVYGWQLMLFCLLAVDLALTGFFLKIPIGIKLSLPVFWAGIIGSAMAYALWSAVEHDQGEQPEPPPPGPSRLIALCAG